MPTGKTPSKELAREKREPPDLTRLAREAAKLDPKAEQALADEGLSDNFAEWLLGARS
jgi:hypothetical protein